MTPSDFAVYNVAMRTLFVLVMVCVGSIFLAEVRGQSNQQQTITAYVDYPFPNDMSPSNPITFLIYGTNSAGLSTSVSNWPLAKSVTVTNPMATVSAPLLVTPGEGYYVCRVSNFWGLTPFTSITNLPPVASPGNKIRLSNP